MNLNFKIGNKVGGYFSSFFKKDRGDYTNPVRDWTLGLFLAVVVFFGGIVYIALDFYTQFGTTPDALVPESKMEVYREKEVRVFAETYSKKEEAFIKLRGEKTVPVVTVSEPEPVSIEPADAAPAVEADIEPLLAEPELAQ